ncbi:MAG: HD domain-containing protein, partial [Brevefilum sp.]
DEVLHLGKLRLMAFDADHPIGEQGSDKVNELDVELTTLACMADRYETLRTCANHGFRTVWYNPQIDFAPDAVPIHDGELSHFGALEQIPALLKKPSLSTCFAWLDAWHVADNIRRHASLVAWMAYVLGVMLQRKGIHLDPILAHRGGLLHDLDKLLTLDPSKKHGALGAAFMRDQGHADLAEIISGHVMRSGLVTERLSWESKLVFFCDKLAEQDRIVPFDVRLAALKKRYPDFEEVMRMAEPTIWELNDQICSILAIPDHKRLIKLLLDLQKN